MDAVSDLASSTLSNIQATRLSKRSKGFEAIGAATAIASSSASSAVSPFAENTTSSGMSGLCIALTNPTSVENAAGPMPEPMGSVGTAMPIIRAALEPPPLLQKSLTPHRKPSAISPHSPIVAPTTGAPCQPQPPSYHVSLPPSSLEWSPLLLSDPPARIDPSSALTPLLVPQAADVGLSPRSPTPSWSPVSSPLLDTAWIVPDAALSPLLIPQAAEAAGLSPRSPTPSWSPVPSPLLDTAWIDPDIALSPLLMPLSPPQTLPEFPFLADWNGACDVSFSSLGSAAWSPGSNEIQKVEWERWAKEIASASKQLCI
ncbi:hypothetical protein BDK51DRAFT_38273 [Blyttiomyces helicus]|uniref:Uncharacterized protein n=1 Tax=Blyttiomyces helicus TaxID=388810 RepID=A0A4P9WB22_9FUNG|nr:hypothetical protein BDK51DRAFT_38273 [Blyttiomyces helicus]|eukprot:RKO89809.1 hypothetical protein BDK51DRAFT_38273 [Blyttiomyces helicus]